jgi:glycosyltransferase involved in cell wall biosynthesis
MTHPRVSVVIPTYNRAAMLREALQSVVTQTVPVHDIAVVDDGSTDNTAEVVDNFLRSGARIKYIREPHRDRLGEARNRGVAATEGEWIAFLDSDDIWLSNRIEQQLAALKDVPDAAIAFCNVQRFTQSGDMGDPFLDPSRDLRGWVTGDLLEEPVALPSALMVRRDAFNELGGFAERPINEDYELTLHLSIRYPASYVSDVLVRMRAHEGSRSLARQMAANIEYLRIVYSFLAVQTGLPAAVKARGKLGLANVHFKLAHLYRRRGDERSARIHARAFLRLRPLDRRAMPLLISNFREWMGSWTGRARSRV